MNWLDNISNSLSSVITIPSDYIKLIFLTIISIVIIKFLRTVVIDIYIKTHKSARDKYIYNKKSQIFSNILISVAIILIWESHIKSFMTLISVISAAVTLSLRELIINFFAGIYIRINKPFVLEDRVEINGLKGDVVNINSNSFYLLEIGDRVNGEQSTGRIVHVPNSLIFTYPLKNYVKAFKYIWNEITIKLELDSDVVKAKEIIYKIIKQDNVIKETPDKMESQVSDASTDYRIYFNNLKPIIYTSVVNDHIELYIRYLVHPKKSRDIEDGIWTDILKEYKNGNIVLYKGII